MRGEGQQERAFSGNGRATGSVWDGCVWTGKPFRVFRLVVKGERHEELLLDVDDPLQCRDYTLAEKVNPWRGKAATGVSSVWAEMLTTDPRRTVSPMLLAAAVELDAH